ncbi:molybdopterin cofactor-binding domain-containing protein [Brucella sp. NM4]|uniref:molybdopterin cofactor-binding domain-containing protein n=1 Tax=Brucella sp. NM4 TaxID=3045175 RepID=UPI0032DAEF9B
MNHQITRRSFLAAGGIAVAFSITRPALAQLAGGGEGGPGPAIVAANLPGSLKSWPYLDSWIQIDDQGKATVYTGKAELGQGIRTALTQVAAEELDLKPSDLHLVTVDTLRTPDEGLTAGSHSMQDSGTAIRNAAANVRMLLLQQASIKLGIPAGGSCDQWPRIGHRQRWPPDQLWRDRPDHRSACRSDR